MTKILISISDFYKDVSKILLRDYSKKDSFVILMNLGNALTLKVDGVKYTVSKGQTFLIPAIYSRVELSGENGELLEISVNHG